MCDLIIFVISAIALSIGYAEIYSIWPIALFSHIIFAALVCWHGSIIRKSESDALPDAALYSFNILFLVIAPALQLAFDGSRLVNTMDFDGWLVFKANIGASLFMFIYILAKVQKVGKFGAAPVVVNYPSDGREQILYAVLVVIFPFAVWRYLGATADRAFDDVEASFDISDMIVNKFIMFLPVPIFLYTMSRIIKERSLLLVVLALFSLVCVFLTQNPFIEKRNGLGPVYLTILFILIGGLSGAIRSLHYILSGLVAIFLPVLAIFTHSKSSDFSDVHESIGNLIFDHFLEIHYDAWSNIVAAVDMVDRTGFYFGKQLLGTILFAVPRFVWPGKPLPTGTEIGLFLTDTYAMWFTNLSAPLIAEMYLDFGMLGCAIGGFVFAVISRHLSESTKVGNDIFRRLIAIYFSFYLIFLLRGSLMVAVAYGFGNLLSFLVVAWLVSTQAIKYRPFPNPT